MNGSILSASVKSVKRMRPAAAGALVLVAAAIAIWAIPDAGSWPVGFTARDDGKAVGGPAAVRGVDAPWRVGLQIGHLDSALLPDELRRLRTSTGAYAGGIREVEINRAVVDVVAAILHAEGVVVEVLPATIPPGFDADAFVAIHADGNNNTAVRGYKASPPWYASPASRLLVATLLDHYGPATGLPEDLNGITNNMRGYYAFNSRRYRHAIAVTTPAAIFELGYLSNASDRAFLRERPEAAARGIADGLLTYLEQRDPHDRQALVAPRTEYLRSPRSGIAVHASPDRRSGVRLHLRRGDRLSVLGRVGDWYDVRVRASYRHFGWVHAADIARPGF